MQNNFVALAIVLIYFVALFVIAAVSNKIQEKKAKKLGSGGADSFLLAGKSMTFPMVMCSIMGVAIGANATTGAAQSGYIYGFAGGTHPFWLGLGVTIIGIFFAGKYRRVRMNTVSQLYGDAYGGATRKVSVVGQVFMNFVIMVSQFIGGGTILSTLLPEYFSMTTGMLVSAVIYLLIAIFGGWMSCGSVNVLNMIMCWAAVIIAFVSVFANPSVGGWDNVVANLPADPGVDTYLSPVKGMGWAYWLAYPVMMITNVGGQQSQVQCITTAKSEKTARWAFIIGGLLVAPMGYICASIGMAGHVLYPNLENTAAVMPMVINAMPKALAGFCLAGMWAACVSTATNLPISATTLIMNDLVKPGMERRGVSMSGKREKNISVLGIIIFTMAALFCSFFVKMLLNFVGAGLAMSVPFFAIIFLTLYCPKLCRKTTAMSIMIAAYITMVVWVVFSAKLTPIFVHPIWLMSIVTIVTIVVNCLVDKRPAFFRTPGYRELYGSMYQEGTKEYLAEQVGSR